MAFKNNSRNIIISFCKYCKNILVHFAKKSFTINQNSNCTSPPPQVHVPGIFTFLHKSMHYSLFFWKGFSKLGNSGLFWITICLLCSSSSSSAVLFTTPLSVLVEVLVGEVVVEVGEPYRCDWMHGPIVVFRTCPSLHSHLWPLQTVFLNIQCPSYKHPFTGMHRYWKNSKKGLQTHFPLAQMALGSRITKSKIWYGIAQVIGTSLIDLIYS